MNQKSVFAIKGMSCASCANRIEMMLKQKKSVITASVNLASEQLTIHYDSLELSESNIIDSIKGIGFEAQLLKVKDTFLIKGASCASCVEKIEKATLSIVGVYSANMNIATDILSVERTIFFESDDIIERISDAGYVAERLSDHTSLNQSSDDRKQQSLTLKNRFIYSSLFTIPLLYISMGHMLGLPLPNLIDPMMFSLRYAVLQLFLTIPVMWIGRSYFIGGFKSLFLKMPNMETLVALGTGSAFLYSLYGTVLILQGNTDFVMELYYESAATILMFITLGKYLESISKMQTGAAIQELLHLVPDYATLVTEGDTEIVPVEQLSVGNIVLVKPGEKIPTDGVIVKGETAADESMITGESIPVNKKIGDAVVGGSVNHMGTFQFKVTKTGQNTTLSKIASLVQEAQGSKPPIAKLADKVSGIFVPTVMILAVGSSLAWFFVGQESFHFAMTILISVLVIACPCALGLATPTAIMVGTGKAAQHGLIIKNGESLEITHKLETIVFDKTGTITEGTPNVTDIVTFSEIKADDLLTLAASIESLSEHPLAKAVVSDAKKRQLELIEVDQLTAISGKGVKASVNQKEYVIGSYKLMEEYHLAHSNVLKIVNQLSKQGKTIICIADKTEILGVIALADTIKSDSIEAVDLLKKQGIEVVMLTGDNQYAAKEIANQVGIETVLSDVLPEEKLDQIKKLQSQGKIVGMVGDGINDAAALTQADVGIAIGNGTDVAIESADIVIMRNSLLGVSSAVHLSKQTIKNVKENLFWAFGYNVLGIPISMGLLYMFGGVLMNPMIAGAAMSFSSVSVLLNALRLKYIKMN